LTIIPVTLAINSICYATYASSKIKFSLFILLMGVGVATVTDVELQPTGFTFGVLAVLSTAIFQIWQGTKQKEFEISATQLQSGISVWQSTQALVVSMATEFYCYSTPSPCDTALEFFSSAMSGGEESYAKMETLKLVLLTCFIALAVNLCSFGLIGRTSPITFQVVGHAKTCLVLVGGYLMFPGAASMQQMYNNIAGVSVAMVGVIIYGHLKHAGSQNKTDCLDCICPSALLNVCDNNYSKVNPSETEGLRSASSN
jgi:solute carrier family 35 protein E3